ncbi:MAG: UPF0280 family protein [Deltaproteobacteria bacterium]|nr:UPF0280 family protein [Deltaproteobacteria bacterium]
MKAYTDRTYRKRVTAAGLASFQVVFKETDLWVSAGEALVDETRDLILNARHQLESYIRSHSEFLTTLRPYPDDPTAPPVVQDMIEAAKRSGVGPMASVAGAIAEFVGRGLLRSTDQVIVENGGDVFLTAKRDVTVSVFAGDSPLSERIGLLVSTRRMPAGLCSSSGTVGHSFSTGIADAVCVLSGSAALSDAAATALCNTIRGKRDLGRIDGRASRIQGVQGCLVILGRHMAAWGDIELVEV